MKIVVKICDMKKISFRPRGVHILVIPKYWLQISVKL
jgi:hypothetical protein